MSGLDGQMSWVDAPIVRASDPETSHQAANQVDTRRLAVVFTSWVARFGPCTAWEAADQARQMLGVEWWRAAQIASKRPTEANRNNLIEETGRRVCGVTGAESRVWCVTLKGCTMLGLEQ